MATSQVTAALVISVQDLTQPGSANIVTHSPPPLIYSSPGLGGLGVQYASYYNLIPGSALSIINGGLPITPFAYVRNVGPNTCTLTVAYSDGGAANVMQLGTNGWYLFGNTVLNTGGTNGLTELLVASFGQLQTTIEYLVAS